MGLLADIFSGADRIKRNVKRFLTDPSGYLDTLGSRSKEWRDEMRKGGEDLFAGRDTPEARKYQAEMVNLSMNAPMGITVWHGSPHKFDKFDMSKIGTGEGAQAYGHGLYMAESPDVAKSYQSALSADRGFSFDGKTGLTRSEVQDMVNAKYGAGYLDGVLRPSGVADSFMDDMVTGLIRAEGSYPKQYKPGSQRAKVYDELRGQITHADPGSLYKVDIPDEAVARFLDWDKKLSEQAPDVLEALKKTSAKYGPVRGNASIYSDAAAPYMTGQDFYRDLANALSDGGVRRGSTALSGQDDLARMHLHELGIPGIRYLDSGSRSAGQGSSNFVLFDDTLPRILETNGVPTGQVPWNPNEWDGLTYRDPFGYTIK